MKEIKTFHPRSDKAPRGVPKTYLKEIKRSSGLPSEKEVELGRRIQAGDQKARNELVEANLLFVPFIAEGYKDRGLSLDDLIGEGNLGLLEAAKRFDPDKGFKFISYAVWWIRQSILRAIANNSRMVRVPANREGDIERVKRTTEQMEQQLGREPYQAEIADQLGISEQQLGEIINLGRSGKPLEVDKLDWQGPIDTIESKEFAEPDSNLIAASSKKELEEILETLTDQEAEIIRLYYGLDKERPLTLLEIGKRMDLTRERIRQIKERALKGLRFHNRREQIKAGYFD